MIKNDHLRSPLTLPPSITSSQSFSNHQYWQISIDFRGPNGNPQFHLVSPFGEALTVDSVLIQNIDPSTADHFQRSSSSQEKQQIVNQYLQQWFQNPQKYHIHVEKHEGQHYVRIGDPGLRGGGKEEGYACSAVQIVGGSVFTIMGWRKLGPFIISVGVSGALDTYQTKEEEFSKSNYSKKIGYSCLGGLVSAGVGGYLQGAHLIVNMGQAALSAGASAAATTMVKEVVETGKLPSPDKIITNTLSAGIIGGVGPFIDTGVESLIGDVSGHLALIGKKVVSGGVGGAVSGGLSAATSNALERKKIHEGMGQAALAGAVNGAATGILVSGCNQIHQKIEQLKLRVSLENAAREKLLRNGPSLELSPGNVAEEELLKKALSWRDLEVQDADDGINADREELLKKAFSRRYLEVQDADNDVIITGDVIMEEICAIREVAYFVSKEFFKLLIRVNLGIDSSRDGDQVIDKLIDQAIMKVVKPVSEEFFRKIMPEASQDFNYMKESFRKMFSSEVLDSNHPVRIMFEENMKLQQQLLKKHTSLFRVEKELSIARGQSLEPGEFLRFIKDDEGNLILFSRSSVEKLTYKAEQLKSQVGILEEQCKQADYEFEERLKIHHKLIEEPIKTVPINPLNAYLVEAKSSIQRVLQPQVVQPVEQEDEDLTDHVILVHAVHQHHLFYNLPEYVGGEEWDRMEADLNYKTLVALKLVFTKKGVIGRSKNPEKQEYKKFIDRPTIHWAWNQLVQPNSGAPEGWEGAKIAILEPLKTFEKSSDYKVFSPTPYDTETMGEHALSPESTILVPHSIVDEVREYLNEYPGEIRGFDLESKIRGVIFETLQDQEKYPEIWHICEEKGKLIGHLEEYLATGFRSKTCLKKPNGEVEILLMGENNNCSGAMRRLSRGRFVGLHMHSHTYQLEDAEGYFGKIEEFRRKGREIVHNDRLFAASIQNFQELQGMGSLSALKLYQQLSKDESLKTSLILADYIINNAIDADLESLAINYPKLSAIDLKLLIDSSRPYLIDLLENIGRVVTSNDIEQQAAAYELFDLYKGMLYQILEDYQKASEKSDSFLQEIILDDQAFDPSEEIPLCMTIAETEWEKIEVPDNTEFELADRWPLEDEFSLFAEKVVRTIPSDFDKLKQLYLQLRGIAKENGFDPRIVYKTNIIRSLISQILKQQTYLKGETIPSLLASKAYRQNSPVSKHGLYLKDYTRQAGDCLFANISPQLNEDLSSDQLRRDLVEYMRDHSDVYSHLPDYKVEPHLLKGDGREALSFSNWDEYLDCMSTPTVWATDIELGALSNMLQAPVVVFTDGKNPKVYNRDFLSEPLFIHHSNSVHFQSCVPFEKLSTKEIFEAIVQNLTMQEERKGCADIKGYLAKRKTLKGYEVIETLKLFGELKEFYKKSAGVGEGYTVETHTKMVLDVLKHDFENNAEFLAFLEKISLTFEEFKLFLALHDIGKGRAVDEVPYRCPERKEKELRYTIETIQKHAARFAISPRIVRIFEALLLDDFMGDYFQCDLSLDRAVSAVMRSANHCFLEPEDMLELQLYFNKIDASSYPILRVNFFDHDSGDAVEIGNETLPKIVGYCEVYEMMAQSLRDALFGEVSKL
ncbi:MAG: hypothetical protein Q8L98_01620 [Chlamydiales bacterium]|nr:hypothetical protein [Chlamydiales bacterium]